MVIAATGSALFPVVAISVARWMALATWPRAPVEAWSRHAANPFSLACQPPSEQTFLIAVSTRKFKVRCPFWRARLRRHS